MSATPVTNQDILDRLAAVVESRKPANGGDPEKSYVARLLFKGPDAFLKKIGEEATETAFRFNTSDVVSRFQNASKDFRFATAAACFRLA